MRWLREIWAAGEHAEALEHAAPTLTAQVEALFAADEPSPRDVRRTALSVARYLLRARHRPTLFGLFAGITTATVGPRARAEWGTRHAVSARAGAEWLAIVVQRLETCPVLLDRLTVLVNNTIGVRGDRLIVPFQADGREEGPRAVEASLALTDPVRTVLAASRTPIRVDALAGKLTAEFPGTAPERVQQLIEGLVRRRVLLTVLQAPSTVTDPLAYLLDQLDAAGDGAVGPVADTVRELHAIHADLTTCETPGARKQVAQRMRALEPGLRRHPLALDLRLDARIALPEAVAREAERAAWVLTRVCARPYGTAAWGAYHQRFYERYGIGTMVPLGEVVADSGTGFPEGYPGAPAGPRRPQLSSRDDALVRIAQTAVLDGRDEVVLTDELLADLDVGPKSPRVPPHLEISVRVHAASVEDLDHGRFRLEVVSVSRGAGVSSGRFLSVLAPDDRASLAAELSDLPTADADTVPVQLSFPPLLPESAHVIRTPQVLPILLSVEEHRAPADHVLTPEDLAVACDGRRLYLAAPARGHRVEPIGMHALNLQDHTPPLVRFLTELSRAQCAQVTAFDWGAAAAMPYLPRLRYGRTVLAPARWRLVAADLPRLERPAADRVAALEDWRTRRRAPRRVFLVEDDRRLFLDLDQAGHRTLLRQHLGRMGTAVLHKAPAPGAYGWCEGRAHEVVLSLKATRSPDWPPLPAPTVARTQETLVHSDDETTGRVLSRRQALSVLGVAGAGLTLAGGLGTAAAGTTAAAPAGASATKGVLAGAVDCVVKPEMTVGPYFVDEGLNRSDIRSDPSDGSTVEGTRLALNLNIAQITNGKCLPLPGAQVDIWQCDAFGLYSDVEYENSVGRKFLRGYQVTDHTGRTGFVTILPGWYPTRTIHMHVKVRTTGTDGSPYEFTSQLYFDEAFKAGYLSTEPYASTGTPDTTNDTDIWYGDKDAQMHLRPRRTGNGYEATFTIGLDLSDTAVGAPDVFTVPTTPA